MGKGMGFAAELQRRLTEQELIGVQAIDNCLTTGERRDD